MRRVPLLLLLVLATAVAFTDTTAQGIEPAADLDDDVKLLAVRFHADWCGNCRALDARLDPVLGDFDGLPVRFLRFDITDDATKQASRARALEHGLGDLFDRYVEQTGLLLLVDSSNGAVVQQLTRRLSSHQLRSAILAALGT